MVSPNQCVFSPVLVKWTLRLTIKWLGIIILINTFLKAIISFLASI